MVFIAFLMVFIDSSGKKKDKWNYPPLLYEVVSKIWVCVYSEMGGLNGKMMTKRGILEGDNIAINSFTPHSSWPNSGSKFYLVQSRQSTKDRSPMQVVAAGHLSHLLPNTLLDRMSWKIYNWSILKSPFCVTSLFELYLYERTPKNCLSNPFLPHCSQGDSFNGKVQGWPCVTGTKWSPSSRYTLFTKTSVVNPMP